MASQRDLFAHLENEMTDKSAARAKPRIEAPAPVVEKSERVEKERQAPLFETKAGELPPLKLLDDSPAREAAYSSDALEAMSRLLASDQDFAFIAPKGAQKIQMIATAESGRTSRKRN